MEKKAHVPARKIRTGDVLADGLTVWSVEGDPADGVKICLAKGHGEPVSPITVPGNELIAVRDAQVLRPDANEIEALRRVADVRFRRLGFQVEKKEEAYAIAYLDVRFPGLAKGELFDLVEEHRPAGLRSSMVDADLVRVR